MYFFSLIKNWVAAGFWVCLYIFLSALSVYGQTEALQLPEKPEPARFVNDFAGILDPAAASGLEAKLQAVSAQTTNQIVVVTVATLADYEISDFSVQLALKWGIGQKDKSNGALLLVALNEKKIRIETGYGLEGDLPDIICKQIIDQLIKPSFKAGNYSEGILLGTDAMLQKTIPKEQWVALGIGNGELLPKEAPQARQKKRNGWGIWIVLGIILLLSSFRGGRSMLAGLFVGSLLGGGRGGGGGFGGGGGGGGSFGGGSFGGGGASGDW